MRAGGGEACAVEPAGDRDRAAGLAPPLKLTANGALGGAPRAHTTGSTTIPAAIAEPTARRAPRTSSSVQSRERTTLTEAPSQSPRARRRQASTSPHRTSSTVAREPATHAERGQAAELAAEAGSAAVTFRRESSFSTRVPRELRMVLKTWRKSTRFVPCGQQVVHGPGPSENRAIAVTLCPARS